MQSGLSPGFVSGDNISHSSTAFERRRAAVSTPNVAAFSIEALLGRQLAPPSSSPTTEQLEECASDIRRSSSTHSLTGESRTNYCEFNHSTSRGRFKKAPLV